MSIDSIISIITVLGGGAFTVVSLLTFVVRLRSRSRLTASLATSSEAGREELDESVWRLREYTRQREEAEADLDPFIPVNPRQAKRLVNHARLMTMIAEDREIFGGTPELTRRHLAKWVLLVEHWSRLGAALTSNPAAMGTLEAAGSVADLKQKLADVAPGVPATAELLAVLRGGSPLGPVLDRLVRFAPARSAGS